MLMPNEATAIQVVQQLTDKLKSRSATIATAESCTGGLLAALLTHLPGSSDVYLGGASAYSNEAKTALLGVDRDLIALHGAVSREVAEAMARGAAHELRSDYAIAITGIAGPGGATEGKPVGTTWCGFHGPSGTTSRLFSLEGDRAANRARASLLALEFMLGYID